MADNIYKYWHYSNKIINMIMLIIYNPIGTSFACGFQLRNKKSLYYTYLKYKWIL
jgi:outer membrane lipopolysaccharide assembly protein LptE/RlpB